MKNNALQRLTEIFAKPEPTYAEIAELRQKFHERELEIRARLRAIEDERHPANLFSIDGEKLAALETEARGHYAELALLPARLHEIDARETVAQRREAPPKAVAALKRLGPALDAAEKAKEAWLSAKAELNLVFGEIGTQRGLAREGGHAAKRMSERDFERFVSVMEMAGEVRPDNIDSVHTRTGLQRIAGLRANQFDEAWEVAYNAVLQPFGFELSPNGFILPK